MTYLELCQALAIKASVSGVIASVVRQSGEAGRVVGWIAEAYRSIQNAHEDWEFKRRELAFSTTENNAVYSSATAGIAAGDFGAWRFVGNDWRCYQASIGYADEQPVRFMAYDHFRRTYGYGAQREVRGRPLIVTVRPDQSLVFWPTPDGNYNIVGEQHRAPARMVANEDVPVFAPEFHDAILYRALMLYAEYEGDPSIFQSAQTEYLPLLGKLESKYLPDWDEPEPFA